MRQDWGEPHTRERDFDAYAEFHRLDPLPAASPADDLIDDDTWADLDLGAVFTVIDRTLTAVGECVLYRILRSPLVPPDVTARRRRIIAALGNDRRLREALQMPLATFGRHRPLDLVQLLWGDPLDLTTSVWVFRALVLALGIAVAAEVMTLSFGWALVIVACFTVNTVVYNRQASLLEGRLPGLRQLADLISAAHATAAIEAPEVAAETAALRAATRAVAGLKRRIRRLLPDASMSAGYDLVDSAAVYLNIILLHNVRVYYACAREMAARRAELASIFAVMGELDVCQSIAGWRAELRTFAEPAFADDGPALDVVAARHPLLAEAVPNSLRIERRGIVVTGSNMSGKTTFLRTIAVNVLLAQTIATCPAESYRGRPLRIAGAINARDDLSAGKSYYLAEAERLLHVVRMSEAPRPALVVIDEPLAGTNSPERLAASHEILRYLARRHAVVMVSTHDVGLTRDLAAAGLYDAYHFADSVGNAGIHFDYQLRAGLDYRGNAILVLRQLGFPAEIVDAAQRRLLTNAPVEDGRDAAAAPPPC